MFKTYPIGKPFGVELRLHSTLVWLVGIAAVGTLISAGPAAAIATLLTILMLAVSVTLHELGHIGAARLFGIGTTGITLYPFGGIARLTRESKTSTEEVVVALAGPAVTPGGARGRARRRSTPRAPDPTSRPRNPGPTSPPRHPRPSCP